MGRAELWGLTPRILASSRLCWRQNIGFTNEDTYFTQPIVRSAHWRPNKWPLIKAWFLRKLELATTIVIYYMYKGLLVYVYTFFPALQALRQAVHGFVCAEPRKHRFACFARILSLTTELAYMYSHVTQRKLLPFTFAFFKRGSSMQSALTIACACDWHTAQVAPWKIDNTKAQEICSNGYTIRRERRQEKWSLPKCDADLTLEKIPTFIS